MNLAALHKLKEHRQGHPRVRAVEQPRAVPTGGSIGQRQAGVVDRAAKTPAPGIVAADVARRGTDDERDERGGWPGGGLPAADVGEFQQRPMLSGIPFLAPWADLLSEPGFWADGKHFTFNMELGNVRGKMPSHGLLVNAPQWRVTDVAADAHSAHVTSRLEFWRYPDLMAQWPFAHEYEMTYSLADGALEVRTTVTNLSDEAMPLVLGFHPYLRIPGIPRDEWTVHSAARIHVIPGEHNIPTGEMRPLDIPRAAGRHKTARSSIQATRDAHRPATRPRAAAGGG